MLWHRKFFSQQHTAFINDENGYERFLIINIASVCCTTLPIIGFLKEFKVNTTDTSATKPVSTGINAVALNSPEQIRKENKLPLHINGIGNSNEKIKLDGKNTCNKKISQYTQSLHKIRFNPDITFNKNLPAVFTKSCDIGEF